MEPDENLDNVGSKKHSITDPEEYKNENIKKVKSFSAKEFRKQLNQENRLTALKLFLSIINESKKHDYVYEYLESGGSCLELLQTLELDSTIPPVVVFELITNILLKVTSNYPQYQTSTYEACRYMLNNYIPVVNKMINLSSTSQERKECLKLLTAMVTFSSNLPKDILLQVNFHSTNVELLTKNTGEKDSVRDYFVRFLTAFLVDGNYPSLSTLLEKKGFISSIINGLQYDSADTVCMVISAMKNHILENPLVSKTAKMKVFNTLVVRDIVNLYNWKGPAALKAAQRKSKNSTIVVDSYSKSKVNECVHDFLLVLCTSHKFGVIFKDHLMGLGKKNQNALMYTVLESLERPWEHSYACDLVSKICGACPDLSKTMWSNLKLFLEPRMTQKWVNAMKFAKLLLGELQPSCIEFCVKELSVYQLAQVIQFLVAPLPILKMIIPENHTYERPSIKKYVTSLLLGMLKSLQVYLRAANGWLSIDDFRKLKYFITNHVTKNFLDAKTILNDWENEDNSDIESISFISQSAFLEMIFDIFELYKGLAPQLLDTLSEINIDLSELLSKVNEICEKGEQSMKLQIKIVDVFTDFDQSKFTPKTGMFSTVFALMLQFHYETQDSKALAVLRKLLISTEIFDGCSYEINIWINGVLGLKSFDESVAQVLIESLKITATNTLEFIQELSTIKSETGSNEHTSEILESLLNENITTEYKTVIKHRYMSPMILGFLNCLSEIEVTKSIKVYVNFVLLNLFHCQTESEILRMFVQSYDSLPKNIRDYFLSWTSSKEIAFVKNSKGKFGVFHGFSKEFLTGNLETFLDTAELTFYTDLPLNLLQASIFYLSNLLSNGTITQPIVENCEKFITFLLEKGFFNGNYVETVLGHPVLLQSTSFLNLEKEKPQSFCTKFLLNIIKKLLDAGFNIEDYLNVYRGKLLRSILRILRKPQKYGHHSSIMETLQLFNLSYDHCLTILSTLEDVEENANEYLPVIFDILSYCLEHTAYLCRTNSNLEPLKDNVVQNLAIYFTSLCEKQEVCINKLSLAFQSYFEVFPHSLKDINSSLFIALLKRTDFSKENVNFTVFLLERNTNFFDSVKDNLDHIYDKKGVILPLVQVLVDSNFEESTLENIFEKLETSLVKTLQKPHKANQHFHQSYRGVVVLIEKFMSVENCRQFLEKVQKFEVAEVFHAKLLEAVSTKVINNDVSSKKINNIILIFTHLQLNLFKKNMKSADDMSRLSEIALTFNNILTKIELNIKDVDLKGTTQNESLKLYFKYCLKFGVSEQTVLLRTLTSLMKILATFMPKEDSKLIFEMLLSHSEFLNHLLGEHSDIKLAILSLFLVLCKQWTEFMERNHIPLLLAAYRAMVNRCDRIILTLLRMYESKADQTKFYDFSPYLWGKAAANHYSVRLNIENVLWRQPKMGDVLDILQEDYVRATIVSYPLKEGLHLSDVETEVKSYDLKFLLPLFSQLLAPEQQVQTYKFTRSGALSLTVVGLSSQDKEVRQAASHVLSRFNFHMDARQSGKDNLLWIRYIEAVCKGTALLPDFKLNNFSAIYLARMALVLTQPNHVMYVPLSQHLTAKSSLDFSTVPELYTFLHSSDVNYKEHRTFILELLRDGLRIEKDFTDFLRSMAFKLFSELYSSSLSDLDTKLLILDVINAACKIPLGGKMLCENHSLLSQIFTAVNNLLVISNAEKQDTGLLLSKFVYILLNIARILEDRHSNFMVVNIVMIIVKDDVFNSFSSQIKRTVFEILYLISGRFEDLLSDNTMSILLNKSEDKFCKYIFNYGCQFLNVNKLDVNYEYYVLRLLFFNKLKK